MARKVFWIALKVFAHFFVTNTINTRFFVAKTIYALFLSQKEFTHTFFVAKTIYGFFVAKPIYALHPDSLCALKVAIRKVQTFWATRREMVEKAERSKHLSVGSLLQPMWNP